MMRARIIGMAASAALGCVLLALGCEPGSTGPDVGGQTGDPGVTSDDFVSAMQKPDNGAGSCAVPAVTDVPLPAAMSWPVHGSSPVLALALRDGDPSQLVVADLAFGLRVVDARDPGALHAGPALALDAPPVELQRLAGQRLLVISAREVLLVSLRVSLADVAPEIVARAALDGTARSSRVLVRDGEPVLHVVVDHPDPRFVLSVCSDRARTSLERIAVRADRLEPLSAIELGEAVQVVRFEGDGAIVVSARARVAGGWTLQQSGVQWLPLAAAEPKLGPRTELPGGVAHASDVHFAGTVLEALVLHFHEDRAELVRFDASDPDALVALPGCELPLGGERDTPGSDPGGWFAHRVVFTDDGVVVRDGRADVTSDLPTSGRIVRVADSSCELQELTLPASAELQLGPDGTLLALGGELADPFDADTGPLEIALFDFASTSPDPLLTTQLPIEQDGSVVTSFAAPRAQLIATAAPAGESAGAFLLVPTSLLADGQYAERAVVLAVGRDGLELRAPLLGAFAPLMIGTRLYAAGQDQLQVFALDGDEPSVPLASSALFPLVGHAWLFDDMIAQLRAPVYGPWTEAESLRVELVTSEPADGEPIGAMDVAGSARVLRVGEHIVALDPGVLDEGNDSLTVHVLDVGDPANPHEVGMLETDALQGCGEWNPQPASVDGSAVATENALILRAACPIDGHSGKYALGFAVIDLRDPTDPVLHVVAGAEHVAPTTYSQSSADSLLADETVYLTYPVAAEVGDDEHPELRYFLRTLDLSAPGDLALSEPVNVPGQVIAADGSDLYLRDQRWDGDVLKSFVHRVRIADGSARVEASMEIDAPALSARVSAGELAVTSYAPACLYCIEGDSQLLMASKRTLALHGTLALEGRAAIAGQVGDTLVIDAPARSLQLIDVADARSPALARAIPAARLADLDAGNLLYIRGGGEGYDGEPGALGRVQLQP